jgi:hypothetical protein
MRLIHSITALAVLIGCANGAPKKVTDDKLPTCTTLAECKAHEGKRVTVVGIYTLFNVMPARPLDKETAPVRIVFGDEIGPYLGAYWHPDARRAQSETTRLEGKRVRVTGTFLSAMPPNPDPRAASLGGPCLHPVESVDPE